MTGLPKKFAKMGFAKGWKAYRAAGGGGKKRRSKPKRVTKKKRAAKPKTIKRRRKTAKRKARVFSMARRKRSGKKRFASVNRANIGNQLKTVGMGAAGAVGGAMLSNAIPIADIRIKAAIPLIAGIVLSLFIGKKSALMQKIGMGMSIGGALGLVRAIAPNMPLLAGEEPGQIAYTPADVEQALITGAITPDQAQLLLDSSPELMGASEEFSGETDEFGGEEDAIEYADSDEWDNNSDL